MAQIIKLLASVCQCVCRRSYGRNFYSIGMKFCTVFQTLKNKMELVWGKNLMTLFSILSQLLHPHS